MLKDALTLIAEIRRDNPMKSFAISDNGTAIGLWRDDLGEFVTCCALLITGEWVRMPGDLRINGKRVTTYAAAKAARRDLQTAESARHEIGQLP